MITVWGRATSSNVQCVMWCIAELGLECERIDAGLTYGVTKTPDYLAMNPNATIPTIRDGDNLPLWESGAIIRYLANAYGSDPFWPSELLKRTEVDRWAEWAKVSVQMSFSGPIFWKVIRTSASERDPNQIKAAIDHFESVLSIADARLASHQYLVDDTFTSADIMFGHILYRYFDLDIERIDLPNLKRYYDDLVSRPHYNEHVMVNYDSLRATS